MVTCSKDLRRQGPGKEKVPFLVVREDRRLQKKEGLLESAMHG